MTSNTDTDILAIETSCDETAAAVVRNGREILSSTIYTQIAMHTVYGGVVPELASRKHIEKINADMPKFKRIKQVFIRTEPFEKTTTQKIKISADTVFLRFNTFIQQIVFNLP